MGPGMFQSAPAQLSGRYKGLGAKLIQQTYVSIRARPTERAIHTLGIEEVGEKCFNPRPPN